MKNSLSVYVKVQRWLGKNKELLGICPQIYEMSYYFIPPKSEKTFHTKRRIQTYLRQLDPEVIVEGRRHLGVFVGRVAGGHDAVDGALEWIGR